MFTLLFYLKNLVCGRCSVKRGQEVAVEDHQVVLYQRMMMMMTTT